jgi:hypothetical protein
MVYRAIGKAVVKYASFYLSQRYGRSLRIGAGIAAVAVGIAVYLANRDAAEG